MKIARNAPIEVIRAAYRSLALKHHPDRRGNHPESTRILQVINASYEALSDPVLRAEHDRWIKAQIGSDQELLSVEPPHRLGLHALSTAPTA